MYKQVRPSSEPLRIMWPFCMSSPALHHPRKPIAYLLLQSCHACSLYGITSKPKLKSTALLKWDDQEKNLVSQYISICLKFTAPLQRSVGRVAKSVQWLATGWTVRGSNPGGGEILRTCPDRPWDSPSLLYNGYRVFPGGKERPERDADPSHPSSAVVMKR